LKKIGRSILPTIMLPISFLAYTSVIGILSSLLIVFVLFYDGLTKLQAPGSLFDPSTTELFVPIEFQKTGLAFGLFMAGFSGHAVVPSLARDMAEPAQFKTMIKWAFVSEIT
jgi:vesicular inhibitory amino acid transporter